jgi:hypothetical protein
MTVESYESMNYDKNIRTGKEVKKMTDMRRVTISIPKDVDRKIVNLRQSDSFVRSSYSELVRMLIDLGLERVAKKGV